jgi:hypothetical protein
MVWRISSSVSPIPRMMALLVSIAGSMRLTAPSKEMLRQ